LSFYGIQQAMLEIFQYSGMNRTDRDERIRRSFSDCFGRTAYMPHLDRTEKGKPYFRDEEGRPCPPYFSVTDSGDFWIIAYSDRPVGIDLQRCGMKGGADRCLAIGMRFFHPEEYQYLLAGKEEGGDPEVMRRFFRIWTARESYVKYTGSGIDASFSALNVLCGTPDVIYRSREWKDEKGETWCFCLCRRSEAGADGVRSVPGESVGPGEAIGSAESIGPGEAIGPGESIESAETTEQDGLTENNMEEWQWHVN
jgi:phosphopantetheinyl transferase